METKTQKLHLPQIIFLGPPGSGKGTQAKYLAKHLGYKHLSTGDLLRVEIQKKSSLGKKVAKVIDEGKLVNDQMIMELFKAKSDLSAHSYIFDGLPRNLAQSQMLDTFLPPEMKRLAIYFEINLDFLLERLTNRLVCTDCGTIYNLKTNPPALEGKCDRCKCALSHRSDDNENTVKKRQEIFKETIEPILDYYRQRKILKCLNAAQEEKAVFRDLKNMIELGENC